MISSIKQSLLGMTSLLALGGCVQLGAAPAPAAKTWRVGNMIYTKIRYHDYRERQNGQDFIDFFQYKGKRVPEARYDAPIIAKLYESYKGRRGFFASGYSTLVTLPMNRSKFYFPTEANRKKRDVWCLYDNDTAFTILFDTKRPDLRHDPEHKSAGPWILCVRNVWGHNMLSVFTPPPNPRTYVSVPTRILDKMSPEDRAYSEILVSVVNENLTYIGEIPFYKPDLQRPLTEIRMEAETRCIPEKYLLTGDVVDRLPKKLVDPSKLDLQKRLGFPVYDLSDFECAEAWEASLCEQGHSPEEAKKMVAEQGPLKCDRKEPFSRYSNFRFVDSLVQIQGRCAIVDRKREIFTTMQDVQYLRAQKSLKTLFNGMKEEYRLQEHNPTRKMVLGNLIRRVEKQGRAWEALLQKAMDTDRFLFSLTNPGGCREEIRYNPLRTLTTWGTVKEIEPGKNWCRTDAEKEAEKNRYHTDEYHFVGHQNKKLPDNSKQKVRSED